MLPVSESPVLAEQRVCGVEISGLPCLDSGNNLNLTSEYMAGLRCQGISVEKDNNTDPQNNPVPEIFP